ncbi:MAG: hypothetical protein EP344_18935 [Bacteroidetes bacterium]|nr:MAG: hypothetical protein EP344_18935 [Bacteroidota bacterium]
MIFLTGLPVNGDAMILHFSPIREIGTFGESKIFHFRLYPLGACLTGPFDSPGLSGSDMLAVYSGKRLQKWQELLLGTKSDDGRYPNKILLSLLQR